MTSLPALRDSLKTRLQSITGLRVYDTSPGDVNAPAAIVRVESINYATTMGSLSHDITFIVLVLVSFTLDRIAQDKLDAYISPTGSSSVVAAIEADPELGSTCDAAVATSVRNYGVVEVGGNQYLGAEVVVDVLIS